MLDALIIGGGITGAGILRDLSLHGINCLLVEKGDFASQTSQSSSKMLHGGIRYLEHYDFDLVEEALHEKNLWLKLTPHLCQEKPFMLPIYKESKHPLFMLRLGLFLYDLLSGFKNSPHQILSQNEALKIAPGLKKNNLKGAGLYYDVVVDDAKLNLEVIYDACINSNAEAKNYTELLGFTQYDTYIEATIKDTITGIESKIEAKNIIFATGPFTDILLKEYPKLNWKDSLLPTKGVHLWLNKNALNVSGPLVIQTFDERIIFVIPQRDAILIGTTETPVEGDYFKQKVTKEDIDYLLANLNSYFPNAQINEDAILSSFAGIRPLVKEEGNVSSSATSREHKVFRPAHNIFAIAGGKYTTFRVMAQEISQIIVEKENKSYSSTLTERPLRQKSVHSPFAPQPIDSDHILDIVKNEKVRTFQDLVHRRLSCPGSKHWNEEVDFKTFFSQLMPTLKKYIQIDEKEIEAY